MPVEQKQKSFQDIRTEYNELFAKTPVRDEDRAYRFFAKRLLREVPQAKDILDLACGGGYFLRELASQTRGQVALTGTDISETALEIARRECPQAKLLSAVAESMPFSSNSFDAITCLGSLEHFLDIDKAVAEMKRITRSRGLFFILVPNLFWYKDLWSVLLTGNRKDRNQTQERFASLGEWKEMFEGLGLEVVKTEKYNGIARYPWKQLLKDGLIPLRFSYHFLFLCRKK